MAKYVLQLANGKPLGTYTSIAKRDAAIKADVSANGNRGPYVDVARKEEFTVTVLTSFQIKVGAYGGQSLPPVVVDSDTLAPTAPSHLAGTPQVGSILWVANQSSDAFALVAASGIDKYQIRLQGSTIVDVAKPAGGVNANVLPTLTNIGSVFPDPVVTRSGHDITIVTGGLGIGDASDQLAFVGQQVGGDFSIEVTVQTFTGDSTGDRRYAPSGLQVRGGLAADAVSLSVYKFLVDGDQATQVKARTAIGGGLVTLAYAAGNNQPRRYNIRRVNNVTSIDEILPGGAPPVVLVAPQVFTWLPDTVYIGQFAAGLDASNIVTTAHKQFTSNNGARVVYAQTTDQLDRTAEIRAIDAAGNASAWSAAVTQSPMPEDTVSESAVTWNPGDYIDLKPSGFSPAWFYDITNAGVRGKLVEYFADVKARCPNAKGVVVNISWKSIEPSFDVYDFTHFDAVTAAARAKGLRYWINFWSVSQFTDANVFPDYMISSLSAKQTYFASYGMNDLYDAMVRNWSAVAQARFVKIMQRLGAHVNDDPKFEGILFGAETGREAYVPGTTTPDPEYNWANGYNGFKAIYEAWRAAAPKKMGGQSFNDLSGRLGDTLANHQALYELCAKNFVMYQNPNSVHNSCDVSQIAQSGMSGTGQLPGSGSPYKNYIPIMPNAAAGGDDNDYWVNTHGPVYGVPYQTLAQHHADRMGPKSCAIRPNGGEYALPNPVILPATNVSHRFHLLNDGRAGDASNQWATAQAAFINALSVPTPTVPTCFAAVGVRTGE